MNKSGKRINAEAYRLGFIGIGLMGKPLTLRLLAAGYQMGVWNRTVDKLTEVCAAGAIAYADIGALVRDSDIILLCLADGAVVQEVTEKYLLHSGSANKLVIDLSSIHPETTQLLAEQLNESCGMRWVDAPVSGGVAGAEQGTLAIMAGGADTDIAIAREVLKPLYRQLTHMGPLGSGQITKICNQMIVSCNVLVLAEMMALAQQSGVDAAKIPVALAGGFADSKPLQITGVDMANHDFTSVKWRVKTLLKDLEMALALSSADNTCTPMSALAAQLLRLHGTKGYLEQDPSTLIKLYQSE